MGEPRFCPFANGKCLQKGCEFFSEDYWVCTVKSYYSYMSEFGSNIERFERAVDRLEKLSTKLSS